MSEKKTVRPYTEKERNSISVDEYLRIERDFHDKYADEIDWDEPVTDNLSYDRGVYGTEVEDCFLKLLGDVRGKKVLDIGSGHGNTALNLAMRGAEVSSIDIAPKLIEGCRYRSQKHHIPVDFQVMDACKLIFPDNTFDIIVGFRTIHHLPDLREFSENAHRCLKPGGFLLLVEPQKYNPFVEVGRYFIKNKEDSRTPTEHPIVPKDIRLIRRIFGNLEKREFELFKPVALAFEMLKMPFVYKMLVKTFTFTDHALWYLPFTRPLYWQIVMKSEKR